MIEPKEKVLMVHLVGLNFLRRDSCLKDSALENGYSEKKHFEALQTLVDSLYNSYESNVDKVIRVIKSSPKEPAESLKAKILANNQLYLSPLIPKVIAWRLLITLDEPKSLHRMDRFLTDTLDILDNDDVFAAVFDVKERKFKYEHMNKVDINSIFLFFFLQFLKDDNCSGEEELLQVFRLAAERLTVRLYLCKCCVAAFS